MTDNIHGAVPQQTPGALPQSYVSPVPMTPPSVGYSPTYGYAPRATSNGLAVASMVLGILWLGWLGSVLAVIFGHVALAQIKRSEGQQGGSGMAVAGLVLGYVGALTFFVFFLLPLLGILGAGAAATAA